MRLLNTSSLLLEEFMTRPPPYAILSHTWELEEVLFKDVENGTASQKKGYEKVKACCKLATSEGYKYVWIDTCCIDKSSSAELSEAINSMFEWYRNSAVCYVYLDIDISGNFLTAQDLRRGRWIYRGWTLQELIAPTHVSIFTKHWEFCGSRYDLARQLHEATRISLEVLDRQDGIAFDLSHFSIAMRMSWASTRKTTRPEDVAYCLLGIFDVHLPPLYGEGAEKAFLRLQEQIITKTRDLSFLAWDGFHSDCDIDGKRCHTPISAIARSPACFRWDRPVVKVPTSVRPFRMTNLGLLVNLPLILDPEAREHVVVLPDCRFQYDHHTPLGLHLVPSLLFPDSHKQKLYFRFASSLAKPLLYTVDKDSLQQARNETFYIAI